MAEAETANSAHVANILLGETAAGAEEIEETSLTDELSGLSLDLHNRWEGARFAINPRNPDAARHFCTSAREVIVELINMKAPDAAVLRAKPNCERGPDGKAVARREKIGYLLDLHGAGYETLGDFVETNVNDVMNLFSQFNSGTHGTAGRFDMPPFARSSTVSRTPFGFSPRWSEAPAADWLPEDVPAYLTDVEAGVWP